MNEIVCVSMWIKKNRKLRCFKYKRVSDQSNISTLLRYVLEIRNYASVIMAGILTYLLTHLYTYSLTSLLTHLHTYSLTYLLTHLLTHLLIHLLTHSLT
jgi:hypothetical protein